jgi:parvulin-like peptidyl-prolyl isomerase
MDWTHRFVRGWGIAAAILGLGSGTLHMAAADRILARGKGFTIEQVEVDDRVVEQKVLLQSMGRRVTADEEQLLEEQTLDRLVIRAILLQLATEGERVEARRLVSQRVAEEKEKLGSDDAYRRKILKSGTTPEAFEERMVDQTITDQVIQREIRSKLTVSDEQVRAYYDEGVDVQAAELRTVVARLKAENQDTTFYRDATNRLAIIQQTNLDRLVRPEQARARMLVLFTKHPVSGQLLPEDARRSKRERLARLRLRVLAGDDFAALAREFSEEPDAQRNNAEYLAAKEKVTLAPLREALFSLPLNQVSDIIETDLGYYLIEVLERPPGGKVPFEEAQHDIRQLLLSQEVEKRLPAWFEALKREYEVELTQQPPPPETGP